MYEIKIATNSLEELSAVVEALKIYNGAFVEVSTPTSSVNQTTPIAPATQATVSAPMQAPTPISAVPTAQAPTYTLEQLANAGAALANQGKMADLQAMLSKYNVQALTQLQPTQYGAVATDLRAMGANI